MHIINGSEPSDVVPIAVRHQIIITWVKIKQLLQQQIGPSLGSDDEVKQFTNYLLTPLDLFTDAY